MKLKISIFTAVALFGLGVAVGLAAIIGTSSYALQHLRVGGPLYSNIKLGNDLIADILPPPEYVIEAYLEATLALQDSSTTEARAKRLVQLHKDYDERRDFWTKSDLDPALKSELVSKSDAEVQRFWTALEKNMLPALSAKDTAGASAAYAAVTTAYAAHRGIIDGLVTKANDANTAMEALATERNSTLSLWVWGVSAVVILMILCGILGIALGVIRPVVAMTAVMRRLADGDHEVSIPSLGRQDEIGSMAHAVEVFKAGALENSDLRRKQEAATEQAAQVKKRTMLSMAETVERETGKSVESVAGATHEVDLAAQGLTRLAEQLSSESRIVAGASERALANSETVSAAAEQLSTSIREIGSQIERASNLTGRAVVNNHKARETISSLSAVVGKIAEMTGIISGIAGQTNLLALNATIEAARAGDAGRGFAVVASEVKALSQQTAKSTEEIHRLVAEIQGATEAVVTVVGSIGAEIQEVDGVAGAIAAAIEQQGAATQEIARSIEQSSQNSQEISENIAHVSRDAEAVRERAAEVQSAIADATTNISALRSKLVHVVRTSTEDADRREYPRFNVDAVVTIVQANGSRATTRLIDASENGARLAPVPGLSIDATGVMQLQGTSISPAFVVRHQSKDDLHLELVEGAQQQEFKAWLNTRVSSGRAA